MATRDAVVIGALCPGATLNYYAIDTALPMLRLAEKVFQEAKRRKLCGLASEFAPAATWEQISLSAIDPMQSVLVIFSHLFASRSLGPDGSYDLAMWVQGLLNTVRRPVPIVYTNACGQNIDRTYATFRNMVCGREMPGQPRVSNVQYRSSPTAEPSLVTYTCELIFAKGIEDVEIV